MAFSYTEPQGAYTGCTIMKPGLYANDYLRRLTSQETKLLTARCGTSGGPVVKTHASLQRMWVQALFGELIGPYHAALKTKKTSEPRVR